MDATFTEEQQALRGAVRDLLAAHCSPGRVREVADGPTGWDPQLWERLTALGVTDLPGALELGIVLEECGRRLAPVPVASVAAVARVAIETAAPGHPLLADVRAGVARPILCLDELVVDAHTATDLLMVEDDLLVRHDVREVSVEPQPTMDRTRRVSNVATSATAGAGSAIVGPAALALSKARLHGAVALAHELVGVAQACLDLAVEHARTRDQFGRPIGSYQAVSHRCADMFIAVEAARGHAWFAAWAIDVESPEAALAASRAKASASDAAVFCAQSAIQVHGGIGFTWEHDLHLHLKRARSAAAQLGTAGWHRQRIADLMGAA